MKTNLPVLMIRRHTSSIYHNVLEHLGQQHYIDVIMTTMASQSASLMVVYSIVYSDADQRKHQSSASPAFVWGNHRGPLNSPHKWPVTRKMFPFDDVIMKQETPVRSPLYENIGISIGRHFRRHSSKTNMMTASKCAIFTTCLVSNSMQPAGTPFTNVY